MDNSWIPIYVYSMCGLFHSDDAGCTAHPDRSGSGGHQCGREHCYRPSSRPTHFQLEIYE